MTRQAASPDRWLPYDIPDLMARRPAGILQLGKGTDIIRVPDPGMLPYPDVDIRIDSDYRRVEIVAARFDAGMRLGQRVAQDMVALRI